MRVLSFVKPFILVLLALALSTATPPLCRGAGWDCAPRGTRAAVLLFSLKGGETLCESGGALVRTKYYGTSIYKPIAAYALLKEGAVSPGETTVASKEVFVSKYGITIRCPFAVEGKKFDVCEAVAESDNCYFYLMGQRLSLAVWKRYYGDFGLAKCLKVPGGPRDMAEFPAHGGKCVRASAVDLVPYITRLATEQSVEMAQVRRAMEMAVERGTAVAAKTPGLAVCGKTGWLNGIGQFIAFAPAGRPEVGLVVTVPGSNGAGASRIGGSVLRAWFFRAGAGGSVDGGR